MHLFYIWRGADWICECNVNNPLPFYQVFTFAYPTKWMKYAHGHINTSTRTRTVGCIIELTGWLWDVLQLARGDEEGRSGEQWREGGDLNSLCSQSQPSWASNTCHSTSNMAHSNSNSNIANSSNTCNNNSNSNNSNGNWSSNILQLQHANGIVALVIHLSNEWLNKLPQTWPRYKWVEGEGWSCRPVGNLKMLLVVCSRSCCCCCCCGPALVTKRFVRNYVYLLASACCRCCCYCCLPFWPDNSCRCYGFCNCLPFCHICLEKRVCWQLKPSEKWKINNKLNKCWEGSCVFFLNCSEINLESHAPEINL